MSIMKSLLLLMVVLAVCWASKPIKTSFYDVSSKIDQEVVDDYRLPETVIPTEYKIELTPTFESSSDKTKNFTFKGKATIKLNILKDTNKIKFHTKELVFEKEDITLQIKENGKPTDIKLNELSFDSQKDFASITFQNNELKNTTKLILTVEYTGELNDDLRGFYRSSYQNKNQKRWLATTHFEPVGARRAFPCWDEPHIKTPFTIIITVPDDSYQAISNMKGKKENKVFTFDKTPPMPTYLVAFVVSDFTAEEENDKFKVWANPTVQNDAKEFAFDFGLKTLGVLSIYTNFDYFEKMKMTKMDQIAIPDFTAGAMENWGLVTYREPRLLYIDGQTTAEEKQNIATVIAHEFSHQWFGNLVTCKKWNYIWLNEGFATFFQYYISDQVIPHLDKKQEDTWRLMEQFVVKNVQASSFVVDANSETRALNPKNIQTPTQISSLFDDIAYKKGASILYMIYGFLPEDIFQKGLQKYLQTYSLGSVDSDDFFKSIESSNKTVTEFLPKDKTLKDVMDNWVNKPGYPVITVKWENDKSSSKLTITQERFFLQKSVKKDETKWFIPANYIHIYDKDDKTKVTVINFEWLSPDEKSNTITLSEKNTKLILFNRLQTGYYRVNYDKKLWGMLVTYLKSKDYENIPTTNRAQLIDDALNLARAGYLEYSTGLEITTYLKKEIDYIPWYAATRAFDYLDSVLRGGKKYAEYRKYVAELIVLFASTVNYTDMENSSHVDKLAKVLAMNTACRYGEKTCEDFAVKKFKEWLDDNKNEEKTKLPLDLRRGIICAALRKADDNMWSKTLKKYEEIKDENVKADVLAGLGCASNKYAEKFLQITLREKPVVNIFAAMNSINAGNVESFSILIKFITDNIEKIRKADKDNSLLIPFLNKLSHKVVTEEQLAEILIFMRTQLGDLHKFELSVAADNLAWIKIYRDEVEKWIVKQCSSCQSNEPDSASSITVTSILLIIALLFTRFY